MDADKIGSFIKELRTQKNMTQKELAEKINCTDKAISRWETGRGVPEVSILIPLSKALDVSVNELLMGERLMLESDGEMKDEYIDALEIYNKTDKNIIDVIVKTNRKINELKKNYKEIICFLILGIIHSWIMFAMPDISRQHYGWPGTEFMAVEAVIVAFFAGLLKSKIKWFFPAFGFIYMAVIYLEGSSIGAMLTLYFCAMIALEMLLSITAVTVLKWLVRKLKS